MTMVNVTRSSVPSDSKAALDHSAFLHLLRCPVCKQELASDGEAYRCTHCQRTYPIVLGIPDLRVYSDPYITIEQDHEKGRIVQSQAERMSFAELLRFYWENVSLPPTPVGLREGFIRHVLSDQARVESFANQLGSGNACLDVGCGAGSLIGAAQRSFEVGAHGGGLKLSFGIEEGEWTETCAR